MTPAIPATDVSAAFITTSPLLLPAYNRRIVRRPRHLPREGDSGCRCRPSRPRVRCTASDERDDETVRDKQRKAQWIPGAWKWPKADECAVKDEVPDIVEDKVTSKNIPASSNESRTTFKWPWQKETAEDTASEGNGVDLETKAAKKVRHSDSKPGASLNGNGIEKEEKQGVTFQERWEGFLQVIVPNMKKVDEGRSMKDGKAAANGSDTGLENSNSPRSSIQELYKAPAEIMENAKESEEEKEKNKWFRMPWHMEAEEQKKEKEVEDNNIVVTQRPGLKVSKVEDKSVKDANLVTKKAEDVKGSTDVKSDMQKSDQQSDKSSPKAEAEEGEKEPALVVSSKATVKIPHLDIVSIPQKDVAAIRLIFGSETFFATETLSPPGGLIFRGNLRGEPKATLAKLEERLKARLGDKYTLCLAEGEEDLRPVVVVVPTARDKRPATMRQRYLAVIIALLAITTIMTRGVYAAIYKPLTQSLYPMEGASIFEKLFATPNTIAITVSVAIGIIIVISQIVQRIVASRHGTRIALPYFIPSVQLGTFGAVVQLASPTPTRAALFDIALSGAATLVILSMACLLIGLKLSTVFPSVVAVPMSTVSNSALIGFLTQQIPNGQILVDYGRSLIGLHPLAVIGANCLTIAALNLLPIRQLDGGRIISALYGRRTAVLASRVTVLFLLLASTKNPYFVVFLAAITFGPWHLDRPSKNEVTEPNAFRTIVGYLFMLLMIGVLLPFPPAKFFGTL